MGGGGHRNYMYGQGQGQGHGHGQGYTHSNSNSNSGRNPQNPFGAYEGPPRNGGKKCHYGTLGTYVNTNF